MTASDSRSAQPRALSLALLLSASDLRCGTNCILCLLDVFGLKSRSDLSEGQLGSMAEFRDHWKVVRAERWQPLEAGQKQISWKRI